MVGGRSGGSIAVGPCDPLAAPGAVGSVVVEGANGGSVLSTFWLKRKVAKVEVAGLTTAEVTQVESLQWLLVVHKKVDLDLRQVP